MVRKLISASVVLFLIFSLSSPFGIAPARAQKGEKEVIDLLEHIELGAPFNYRNLTIVPIYARKIKDRTDYVSLDEALRRGYIVITEIGGGRVPQVKVKNKSNRYVFLMAGEILTGCKQDRLVGSEILLGPKGKEIILPVYCSERGRWALTGREFESFGAAAAPDLRAMVQFEVGQWAIWDEIDRESKALRVRSGTGALADTFRNEKVKKEVDRYVERLIEIPKLDKDVVGVAVGVGEKIVSVDVFANPDLFFALWPKLLRSYALSAIQIEGKRAEITQGQVKKLLNNIYKARYERKDGLDLGEEITMSTSQITSFALVWRGGVVHLSLFPTKAIKGLEMPGRVPVID